LKAADIHEIEQSLLLADGGMRVGALLSCRVKNVEFNQYGARIYLSKTRVNKTTPAKGLPLTWSAGYLNQWLAVHPLHEDPEAPLWITLNKNKEAVGYKTIRKMIKTTAEKVGIKKRMYTPFATTYGYHKLDFRWSQ
jgi:integrase/recombinase XerD